jgi:hypothetical protein
MISRVRDALLCSNGRARVGGEHRDAELRGFWDFLRKEGSLLRSRSLDSGTKVRTWVTYTRDGQPHKEPTLDK